MMTLRRFFRNMENPIPETPQNTFQKRHRGTREEGRGMIILLLSSFALLLFSGCSPRYTYPSNTVPKSIEDLCKKEYKIDVTARVVGKTVGALVYIDSVVDTKGQVSKDK